MRRFITITAGLGLIWTIWWAGASFLLTLSVDRWLADRRAEGWQAETTAVEMAGFPVEISAILQAPALADPDTGVAVKLDAFQIAADTWWPGAMRVQLPNTPISLASPDGRITLRTTDASAELRLKTDLTLNRAAVTSGPWTVEGADGVIVSAEDLSVSMQSAEAIDYAIDLHATSLAPGILTQTSGGAWPATLDQFRIKGRVTFDRPWDIRALEDRRPQPRAIIIDLAEAAWGETSFKIAADVTIDANARPTGTVDFRAENWQALLDLLVEAGVMPPSIRSDAETLFGLFAGASGPRDSIDVTLTLRNGQVLLGFIPIGPAPYIYLR